MDNKLVCSATNCLHNMNKLCSAAKIHVGGGNTYSGDNTLCETFASRSIGNYAKEMTNVNVVGGLKQVFSHDTVMDPQITCNAVTCVYNNNEYCNAQNLQISGPTAEMSQQTECHTFRPR